MALPKDYVIQLVAGDKYQLIVDYQENGVAVDLTGETVTMKVYSKDTLLFTLASGTGLTITPATGRIQVDMTSVQTDMLDGKPDRKYVLRLDTSEKTIMRGRVEAVLVK